MHTNLYFVPKNYNSDSRAKQWIKCERCSVWVFVDCARVDNEKTQAREFCLNKQILTIIKRKYEVFYCF